MSLAAGMKLGPYEIVGPIGAGGMGEVYKARDTRLARDVAVKVLPEGFAESAERMRRFEREAKTLAALNHPNILSVFDVGTHEGQPYVVMELLEGKSLREVLEGGPPSVRRAVEVGSQIAKGLAAAHAKGVVHRDLKPGNVFVTKDGQVKVLDFGLARMEGPAARAVSRLSQQVTAETPTGPGMVLGTVGYMAPEQVKGETADARSDLFSFGVVLYEMLSGKRPFERETTAETMTAILREDPPELVRADAPLPAALVRMVDHCLEKSPDARFQSAKDVGFALETLSGTTGTGSGSGAALAAAPAARRRVWSFRPWVVVGALCAAAVLVALAAFLSHRAAAPLPPPTLRQLTFRRGEVGNARFGLDGKEVYYDAAWDGKPWEFFSVRPGNPESRSLGFEPNFLWGVFPNGDLLLLFHDGTLSVAPVNGGAPRAILSGVGWADAGPDPQHVLVVKSESGKARIEYPIGKVIYQTPGGINWPRLSHKGDRVAFTEGGEVKLVNVGGGKAAVLSKGWTGGPNGLAWAPSDREIWFTGSRDSLNQALHAVTPEGQERLIYRAPTNLVLWDVFADGRALISQQYNRMGLRAWDPKAGEERDLSWFDFGWLQVLSADGSRALFNECGEAVGARDTIFMRGTDGSPPVKLGAGVPCDLSPDGEWVLAVLADEKGSQLQAVPTGAGQPKALTSDALSHKSARWMPDGKRFVFLGSEPEKKPRFWIQPVEAGTPKPLTPEGDYGGFFAVSPDGRDLAYVDRGRGGIFLVSTDGGTPRPLPGEPLAARPITFSADGKALFVGRKDVTRVDLKTGQRKVVREIKPPDPAGFSVNRILVTPDEKAYAYGYYRELSDLYVAEGLK